VMSKRSSAITALTILLSTTVGVAAGQEKPSGPYRKLAPGVMKTVKPEPQIEETFSRHDMVEVLAEAPDFKLAEEIAFRRDIWALEFNFKPVRMIAVDVPRSGEKMRRELVWYMVYSVSNTAPVLHPVRREDGQYGVQRVARPLQFIPQFLLADPEAEKVYRDRLIPVAIGAIRAREDPRRRLLNTVEMAERKIKPGETVWGVVTWKGIDPTVDRFSVYVIGLTNAYRWKDAPGAYKPGDPLGTGRRLHWKTLKLNFWRPGDEYYQHDGEIRYGQPGDLDHEWVYR
ncbi:MAG: hypothetical protein ACOC46_00225, partial [Pirellulales bacterium]